MRALRRHPLVRADLEEAFNWYEDQCPGLGRSFEEDVRHHLELLTRQPQFYAIRFADVRRLNLSRFPYGLFFVWREPEIWLLGVLHGSRDTGVLLGRRRRSFGS